MFNKENTICCCIFTIIASLLVGVGVAASFFAGVIPAIVVLPIITLIVAILSIILIVFVFYGNRGKGCFCVNECLIASVIGAVVSSIFALTVTALAVGVVAAAILVGVVAFFLIVNLVNVISLIICLICTRRKCE